MNRERRLGRGLDALLSARRGESAGDGMSVVETPTDNLRPGTCQPRTRIPDDDISELADSIREQGVLQPLVVRPTGASGAGPGYEIVAGERRWRAAKISGLATVPVIVRELDDRTALAVALVENLQREDLNPIDQARSLARLAEEFGLTHEEIAKTIGRSRVSVTNLIRLLDLDDRVKDLLARGAIDMGHARALLPLPADKQVELARRAANRTLSVREVEHAVRKMSEPPETGNAPRPLDLQTRWLQQQMADELGRELSIRPAREGSYSLRIGFADLSELGRTLERLRELVEQVRDAAGPRARGTATPPDPE